MVQWSMRSGDTGSIPGEVIDCMQITYYHVIIIERAAEFAAVVFLTLSCVLNAMQSPSYIRRGRPTSNLRSAAAEVGQRHEP